MEVEILYLCDGKYCRYCHADDCSHTTEIEHALHKNALEGRRFVYGTLDNGSVYFWEQEEE